MPSSWAICRLTTIADIYNGNSINEADKKKYYTGLTDGYNYIGTKDISFDHIVDYENGVKIPFSSDKFRIAYKNSPLLCIEGGSAGRKIAILEEDVCFGNKLCAFRSFGIIPKYLYYYLQSPLFVGVFKSKTTGLIGGVSINTIKELFFAVPPLEEQKRIVSYIEAIFNVIDLVEKSQNDYSNLIEILKRAILKSAIEGTLVEQCEDDEPSSILLEKIRAEKKAQLGKKYVESYIFKGDDNHYYEHIGGKNIDITENIPFELPTNWCWARWGDISESIQYGYNAPAKENGRIKMVRISDIQNGKVIWENVPYCDIDEEDIKNYTLKAGDILFARTGGTVGKSYLVTDVPEEAIYAGYLIRTRYSNQLSSQYLKLFMETNLYWLQLTNGTTATAQPNCNGKTLGKMLLPIPPLAEQERIVSKINEIFAQL